MGRILAWLELFRTPNALVAAAGVWLGWISLRPLRPDMSLAWWGGLSMFLLVAAGNADNDVQDLPADRINRPNRPMPSGRLSPRSVRWIAILLYVLAILLAGILTPMHGALTASMAFLLIIYNRRLKGMPLLGNLAVALLCALAIYFPEFPLPLKNTLPAFLFAFLATLAREIVKDIEDREGDKVMGMKTFALISGINRSRKLAFSLLGLILLLLPLPTVWLDYAWPYAAVSTLGVAPLLISLMVLLTRSAPEYGVCQRRMKWLMVVGMVAMGAGVWL